MAKQFEGYLSDIYATLCSKTALRRLKTYGFAFGQEFRPMYGKFQKATFCGYNLVEFGRNFVQTVWSHWSGFDLGRRRSRLRFEERSLDRVLFFQVF